MSDSIHRFEFSEGPIVGSTLGYKVYTAILSQTGTSAPVATVLTNTLGGTVVWSRVSAGVYNATLTGAFTSGKTVMFNQPGRESTLVECYRFSNNVIIVNTYSDYEGTASDDMLNVTSIEFRVYP